jgi:hypothetical protein
MPILMKIGTTLYGASTVDRLFGSFQKTQCRFDATVGDVHCVTFDVFCGFRTSNDSLGIAHLLHSLRRNATLDRLPILISPWLSRAARQTAH